jgi:hypothetical protein
MIYALVPRPTPMPAVTIYDTPPKHFIETVESDSQVKRAKEIIVMPALTVEDYARTYTASEKQWQCLYQLWWHESKWDHKAEGPTNDWGIPQANADAHPETSEARWRDDEYAQVRWGVEYIKNRYGSFCDAWDAWQSRATVNPDGSLHGGWY